jgi:hypothetical protein
MVMQNLNIVNMDKKISNDKRQILLVEDAKDGKVKAVTNMDDKGNIQTTDPTPQNQSNFFGVNTNDSALEAFFRKMSEQAQNPSHTGFFLVAENLLNKIIKIDLDPKELEPHRVEPAEFLIKEQGQNPKQRQGGGDTTSRAVFQPMDENKIDRSQLDKLGIEWKDIEPNLKAMLYGHKSPKMIPMTPELDDGIRVPTKGRLSLEETADGSIRFVPHYYQEKPALDAPFHGILLNGQDKENILKNGNAGRVVELEPVSGVKVLSYISLDKMTNKLEALPVDKVNIPQQIKGIDISPEQQKLLAEGKKVLVEGMTSRNSRLFDGYIQINAADKKFDFSYEGLDRQRYAQENKQVPREQKQGEQKQSGEQRELFISKKLLGVELTEKQQAFLKEGKATWVKGMMKDGKGEPFNAWVKPNPEKMKFDFFKWNPDKVKKQSAEVTPANESKTQVAVNTKGKTNEAIKNVKESLKQGQEKPTENQQKKQEEKQEQTQSRKPAVKRSSPKL